MRKILFTTLSVILFSCQSDDILTDMRSPVTIVAMSKGDDSHYYFVILKDQDGVIMTTYNYAIAKPLFDSRKVGDTIK